MNLNKRIEKAIEYSGFTQLEVAKALNIPQQRISEMVRGMTKNPKLNVLVNLAKVCKVDLRWLVTGEGDMIKSENVKIGQEDLILVPVIGTVTAGLVTYAQEIKEEKMWFFTKEIPRGAFALRIAGDSMMPELASGDIVVCAPKQVEELKGKGEIVVLKIDVDSMIKCLHKNKKNIILTSMNQAYQPFIISQDKIKSMAKVIFKIRKY